RGLVAAARDPAVEEIGDRGEEENPEAYELAAAELRQQHHHEKRHEKDPKQRERIRKVPDLVRQFLGGHRTNHNRRGGSHRRVSTHCRIVVSLRNFTYAIDIPPPATTIAIPRPGWRNW